VVRLYAVTYTPFTRWSWLDELALRAHDERSSCARRAGLMSWLSGHLNGVILQTFTKLLYERTSSSCVRRASSSSQLHRVNGVLRCTESRCDMLQATGSERPSTRRVSLSLYSVGLIRRTQNNAECSHSVEQRTMCCEVWGGPAACIELMQEARLSVKLETVSSLLGAVGLYRYITWSAAHNSVTHTHARKAATSWPRHASLATESPMAMRNAHLSHGKLHPISSVSPN